MYIKKKKNIYMYSSNLVNGKTGSAWVCQLDFGLKHDATSMQTWTQVFLFTYFKSRLYLLLTMRNRSQKRLPRISWQSFGASLVHILRNDCDVSACCNTNINSGGSIAVRDTASTTEWTTKHHVSNLILMYHSRPLSSTNTSQRSSSS